MPEPLIAMVPDHFTIRCLSKIIGSCKLVQKLDFQSFFTLSVTKWIVVMFRFVAERGAGAQLTHIDNIHRSYELKPVPHLAAVASQKRIPCPSPEQPLPIMLTSPR